MRVQLILFFMVSACCQIVLADDTGSGIPDNGPNSETPIGTISDQITTENESTEFELLEWFEDLLEDSPESE